MKILVSLIQFMVIAGLIYPFYAMWNNENLSDFCIELKPDTTKQYLIDLAEQNYIKLYIENADGSKWHATATTFLSFSNDSCQIRGLGNRVASAKLKT